MFQIVERSMDFHSGSAKSCLAHVFNYNTLGASCTPWTHSPTCAVDLCQEKGLKKEVPCNACGFPNCSDLAEGNKIIEKNLQVHTT